MKTTRNLLLWALLALLALLPASALAKDLDEIENYGVSVQLREDGSMDLTYHVDWKVLDDKAEGPLEWVKIGIPNQHADSFSAISSSISRIGYLSDGGAYVKITFDRAYRAGETVSFDFSFHQEYMYVLEEDTVRFSLTPGWFDGIEVKNAVIRWLAAGTSSSSADTAEGDYLYWTRPLRKGERIRAEVTYPRSYFMTLDPAKQSTRTSAGGGSSEGDDSGSVLSGLFGLGIIVAAFWWIRSKLRDNYRGGSGFGGGHGGGHTVIVTRAHTGSRRSSCVHSSCACASCACASCACACACAGGGRAGCSRKDFYRGPAENAPGHTDDTLPLLFQALENTK